MELNLILYFSSSTDDTRMMSTKGTPEFLAPEMVARQPYTEAVDIWAIGVMTYIMIRKDFPSSNDAASWHLMSP